jgi:EAL domain-containing protein (putative c-di-GMP-specific phosphodiesterase class I)
LRGTYDLLEPVAKRIVVEGVETAEELQCLYSMGFRYFQGYFFAKPALEALPEVDFTYVREVLGEKRYPRR